MKVTAIETLRLEEFGNLVWVFIETDEGLVLMVGCDKSTPATLMGAASCEALAVDAGRNHIAQLVGRRIISMVEEDLKLSKILTKAAFENGIYAKAIRNGMSAVEAFQKFGIM